MKKVIASGIFIAVFMFTSTPAHAVTIAEIQQLIAELQIKLSELQRETNSRIDANDTNEGNGCVELSRVMSIGSSDVATGGQVGKLQQFLRAEGFFTYPTLTGYYGSVTAGAVSSWQSQNKSRFEKNPISGSVDEATLSAMRRGCENVGTITQQNDTSVSPIVLNNKVQGETLLNFRVRGGTDVEVSSVTVNVALPFVKGGDWKDLIKNAILTSKNSQQSVSAIAITDSGATESLLGQDHDQITLLFEIPSKYQKDFTIKNSGEVDDYKVTVDFYDAMHAGPFGEKTDEGSKGYVRATIVEVATDEGRLNNYADPYGPHRLIKSSY